MTRESRLPRPEIVLAVRSEREQGVVVELQVGRIVANTALCVLNLSRDSDAGPQVALELGGIDGVSIEATSGEKVRVVLGAEACDRLQIRDGDSLLLHQSHPERGRSPAGLATILTRSV